MASARPHARPHAVVAKLVLSAALVLATAASFAEVRHAGFLGFDDDEYVTANPRVQAGLTREGVAWAFTTRHVSNWHPLTWLSHMVDVELFGEDPAGHHAMSLALHALNAVLLLWLLARMTGALWPSALVAALFALHPQRVESVAWVAERKDVLSTLLGLLAMLAYVVYTERRREGAAGRAAYAAALALLALGLMAKSMLVTLPFALLLLDVWPLGRARWGEPGALRRLGALAVEKLPLLALSAAASAAAIAAQRASGALWSGEALPLTLRLANAGVGYARYLGKLFWPADLAVFYPHPLVWPAWQVAGSALLLAAVTALALRALRTRPYLAVGWLLFLGMLVPVIGIVQVGNQSIADRYTYLPQVGLLIAVVWGLRDLVAWVDRRAVRAAAWLGAGAALAACAVATARYVPLWRDTLPLFEHALETTRDNAVAHNTVGHLRAGRGEIELALAHFDAALRIRPDYSLAHFNKGATLRSRGDVAGALPHLRRAVELRPDFAPGRFELARGLEARGLLEGAVAEYETGLALSPDALGPRTALGVLRAARGDVEGALEELRRAVGADPEHAGAREQLALVLERAGAESEAAAHYRQLLIDAPGTRGPLRRLAWIRAAHPDPALRDPATALRLALRASTQTGHRDPGDLDLLAAAYAESGRFREAIETAELALRLAVESGASGRVGEIASRLEGYRGERPYRRPPSGAEGAPQQVE